MKLLVDGVLLTDFQVVGDAVDGEVKPAGQDVEVFCPGMAVSHDRDPAGGDDQVEDALFDS